MAASVPTVEECAQRWADGVTAEANRVLASSGSHKEIARAIATLSGVIRTLTRRCGRQMNLPIPGWVRDVLGWEPGAQVVLGLTEREELVVRKATKRDLEPFAALLKLDSTDSQNSFAPRLAAAPRPQTTRGVGGFKRRLDPRRPARTKTQAASAAAPERKASARRHSAAPH